MNKKSVILAITAVLSLSCLLICAGCDKTMAPRIPIMQGAVEELTFEEADILEIKEGPEDVRALKRIK